MITEIMVNRIEGILGRMNQMRMLSKGGLSNGPSNIKIDNLSLLLNNNLSEFVKPPKGTLINGIKVL